MPRIRAVFVAINLEANGECSNAARVFFEEACRHHQLAATSGKTSFTIILDINDIGGIEHLHDLEAAVRTQWLCSFGFA